MIYIIFSSFFPPTAHPRPAAHAPATPGKHLEDAVGEPAVARAVGGVEAPQVASEDAHQRPDLVGVFEAEVGVR